VATIERVVGELDGVTAVAADADTKKVEISFDAPATRDQIVATLTEWDFPPAE
jgi:copper chaperone CopZ